MMATTKPRAISTLAPADIHSSSGCPIQNDARATTGTESPMEATALPSARLMLACSRRRAAARIAAAVSGNNTIAAMMTPTIASGAPAAWHPASRAGAKLRQQHDRQECHKQHAQGCERNPPTRSRVRYGASLVYRKEIGAVPTCLDEKEDDVETEAHRRDEGELERRIVGSGGRNEGVRQHHHQRRHRDQHCEESLGPFHLELGFPIAEGADDDAYAGEPVQYEHDDGMHGISQQGQVGLAA